MSKRAQAAFTLVELMIVVIIVAIVLAIAAPSFVKVIRNNQLRVQADSLVTSLNLARSESVKRSVAVVLCNPDSTTGACDGNLADGWTVFADLNDDGDYDAAGTDPDVLIRVFDAVANGYTLTNRTGVSDYAGSFKYYPDGTADDAAALLVCPPDRDAQEAWEIDVTLVGRPVARQGRSFVSPEVPPTCPAS